MRFGIDFGTTHTVVATIDRGNYPVVSFEHADVIPSLAAVDEAGELHFGRAEPGWAVLRSFKRLLDEGHPDSEVRIGARTLPLSELLTRFLVHVRDQIQHHSNAGLRKRDKIEAAVSVPANASTAQRLITMDAYRRAGFDVKAVLNEPSAAGFEYAHRFRETVTSKREYVLVYDLGGGTFDASLIHMEGRANEVITSSGISRLGGDDFDEAIARLVLKRRGGGKLTRQLLDEVREQKESLNPNSRKFVLDEVVLGVEDVYDACVPLVERTLAAMESAMRDPRREEDEVAWTELAGIYVVGGASAFAPVPRMLRERFGAHRVRRSLHPYGSCAIGLAIHLDEGAGYKLSERLSRNFGVFREDEGGGRISFDVLVPKDTPLPARVSRRYRAAHNVGHYRFVECGRMEEGRPEGNLAAWDELLFPFDPSLRGRDLAKVPVQRVGEGPEVEEIYQCGADGTVTASLRVLDDGFERTLRLSRR
ncbi:MAG TPA: Hsp70 family protein [Myxococcales bacterium]|nr:Hsp70 family protein [Myxococcales bacterium]